MNECVAPHEGECVGVRGVDERRVFGQMDLFVCSLIGHDRLNTEVGCSHCVQRVFDVDVSAVGGGDCRAWQWWMTWSFGSSGTHTSTQGGCPDTSQRWGMANKCSFYHCNCVIIIL